MKLDLFTAELLSSALSEPQDVDLEAADLTCAHSPLL
jgi:hypothetical protein